MKTKNFIPLAGLALFCSCAGAGKRYSESADSVSTDLHKAKVVNLTSDSAQSPKKIVKTANIRFKVKNVQQTSDRIAQLTAELNGTVMHHFINSTTGDSSEIQKSSDSLLKITVFNTTAEMTVKIPPVKVEAFINQVAHMGIIVNSLKMDINDKSLDYLSTQLKLKNQKELVDNQKKGVASPKDPDNLLAFKNNMVDQHINNLKTDDSVKYSTIFLSFYESSVINKEIIANPNLAAYNSPFFERIGASIKNGWNVFIDILVALTNAWVLLPVGLAIWLALRYYNRKKNAAGAVVSGE